LTEINCNVGLPVAGSPTPVPMIAGLDGLSDALPLAERGRGVRANIRAREQALDWLPFSDGPGRCPGQHFNAHEFFLVLDALLPRYRFELVDPTREVPHSETMVVGPEPGTLAVRLRPRAAAQAGVGVSPPA